MAIDLSSESTRRDLVRARKTSEKVLEDFMAHRADLIRKTVGDNWQTGNKRETITNLLYRAYETFAFDLSVNRPRCYINGRNQQQAAFASRFSLAVNNYAESIGFGEEMLYGVMDALFGLGVFKRYWAATNEPMKLLNPDVEEPGDEATPAMWEEYKLRQFIKVDPGQPMIERICPEDYIYDTSNARRRYFRYEMHRYRRSVASIKSDPRYNPDARMAVQKSSKFGADEQERAQRLGELGYQHDADELEPMTTLWDIYLPQEKTFAVLSDDATIAPLFLDRWNGPPGGPFTPLMFSQVPDNFAPISMMASLEHIHDQVNSLFRKQIKRAQRHKEVTTYAGPEGDAMRHKDAKDGDYLRVAAPEAIQKMISGGVDPMAMQFAATMQQLGNREAGNLDLIAGIAPQAQTARQDELLHQRSGVMQNKRMQRVAECTGELYKALGWMMWHDVVLEVPGHEEFPGLSIPVTVDATWKPDLRHGNIDDYEFSYTPYNESYMAPGDRMTMVNNLLTSLYIPLLPALNQSGMTLDLSGLTDFHAQMGNLPELKRFLKPLEKPELPPGTIPPPLGGGLSMPPGEGGAPAASQPAGNQPGGPIPVSQRVSNPNRVYNHEHQTTTPQGDPEQAAWSEMAAQGA